MIMVFVAWSIRLWKVMADNGKRFELHPSNKARDELPSVLLVRIETGSVVVIPGG